MSRDGNEAGSEAEKDAKREAKVVDRLDAFLSARMDDDLTPDEVFELEALIASDSDHAARALAFEKVDAQLRSLAEASIDEDSLATAYAGLRARLKIGGLAERETEESSGPPANRGDPRKNSLGRPVIPLLLAIAAAFVLYLVVPTSRLWPPLPVDEAGDLAATSNGDFGEDIAFADPKAGSELALDVEDELILVLGYGNEMSELQGITRDDLDVIERLELLDFLSDREQALGAPGKRGERG
jgi:hypothetical protein